MPQTSPGREAAQAAFRGAARALFISGDTIGAFLASATPGQVAACAAMPGSEIAHRDRAKRARLPRQARFPVPKSVGGLDRPDVAFPDGWGRDEMLSLAFVRDAEDLVFYGQTGRGKTHMATALGIAATSAGYPVRFRQAAQLVLQLGKAKREGTLDRLLADVAKARLLVLDEFGYVPFDVDGARLLRRVISDSYERRSVIFTANVEFSRWGTVLPTTSSRRPSSTARRATAGPWSSADPATGSRSLPCWESREGRGGGVPVTKPENISCRNPKEICAQNRKSGLTKHRVCLRHEALLDQLQMHVVGDDGAYRIRTACFDGDGREVAVPGAAADVSTGCASPTFGIVRPAVSNTRVDFSPHGQSVFADAVDAVQSVDLAYDALVNEVDAGKMRVFLSDVMLDQERTADGRRVPIPFGKGDCTMFRKVMSTEDTIQEFAPALRTEAQGKAFRLALQVLGDLCGLGTNYFNLDNVGYVKTATEVSSDNSALMRNVRKNENALEGALAGVAHALLACARHNMGEGLPEEGGVSVIYDDSIVQDTASEKRQDMDEVAAGLMTREEYCRKWYGDGA